MHNGSNYDYHFITAGLAKEFKGEFICLRENMEKYITFPVPIKKEIKKANKNGEETTRTICSKLYLLTVSNLWQTHYQTLLIISLKAFIKLNVNIDMIIKNVKNVELNTKSLTSILNIQTYRNMSLKIYELDVLCFLSAPGLA